MLTLLLIVLVAALLAWGGWGYGRYGYVGFAPAAIVLIVLVILLLTGLVAPGSRMRPSPPRRSGAGRASPHPTQRQTTPHVQAGNDRPTHSGG